MWPALRPGTSTTGYTRAHDAVGNLTDDGEDFEYVYEPFGRLRFVKRTDNQAVVAEYRYNGLGFRVGWHYDVDADGTVEGTADDPWFFFAYDEGWRMVATYRSTDSSPKEQFVHHMAGMAGLGGFGGSSYIDAVILRERDANTAWGSAADGTLEERRYYVQNCRADVVAIVTDTGGMVEWVKYSSYGVPFALPAGDTDSDGDFDATDVAAITGGGGGYDVRKDVELDGDVDAFDILAAAAITGGYQTLGWDTLSSPAVNSRRGYAGYEHAPEFAGVDRHLYHVRHRVYDAELGRWTRRDPLGYVDGMGLYEYVESQPLVKTDALGLHGCSDCGACTETVETFFTAAPWAGYPTVRCSTPQRQAACRRWAKHECTSRVGYQSKACHDACVSAAADCCSRSGCNAPNSARRCMSEAATAMQWCNQRPVRQACFRACMAGVMVPGGACYIPCAVCDAVVDWTTVAACITGCTAVWLPGVPSWLQMPYKRF